jgi:hypothetical protein
MTDGCRHTPGPWKLAREATNDFPQAWVDSTLPYSEWDTRRIADVGGRTKDEATFNARLISAAPDLVAACEAYLAPHTHAMKPDIYAAIKAAVAKAKGETP